MTRFTLVVAALLLVANAPLADTFLVMKDGSGDATTISGGVALASAGDSVLIGPGTYLEQVNVGVSLTLVGRDGADATTIDGLGNIHCVSSTPFINELSLEGLQLVNARAGYGYVSGFAVEGNGDLRMSRCKVHDNGGGVFWPGRAVLQETEFWNMGMSSAAPIMLGEESEVKDCAFHDMSGTVVASYGGAFAIRRCTFRSVTGFGNSAIGIGGHLVVEACLFQDLESAAVGMFNPPVHFKRDSSGTEVPVEIRGNTFVRVDKGAIDNLPDYVTSVEFSRNLATGGESGVADLGSPNATSVVNCNNVFGNGTNWGTIWSELPDPTGQDGNISAPPLYCDAANGNFTLATNSPCLPANNTCGVLIGALGEACGAMSIESRSWGQIKAAYRELR